MDDQKPPLAREEQFTGCLIGQCLGDALGAPVEGMPPGTCRRYVDLELDPTRVTRGRGSFAFGQYTDDSQLARELLISYVEREAFDPAHFAERVRAIFADGRVVGGGMATSKAAARLDLGVRWDRAGTPPPAAGNGSAMRAAPIGLLFCEDPEALVRAAIDQGRITHQDPRCAAGSVAIAGAVSLALRSDPIRSTLFIDQLLEWTSPVSDDFADQLRHLPEWLTAGPEEAARSISVAGLGAAPEADSDGITPFVIGSVLWSLYCFLRTPDDYWATIGTAIRAGGDVDTTAAMAGAISGARVGLSSLPLALARRLDDQGNWGFDELVRLAGRAYAAYLRSAAAGGEESPGAGESPAPAAS